MDGEDIQMTILAEGGDLWMVVWPRMGDIWPAWGWSLEHLVVEAALGLERKILSTAPFLFEGLHARTHSQVSEVGFDNYSRLVLTINFNWHGNSF